MNVVDSSAWIEYFVDGPNASRFAAALSKPEELLVPTVSLLEVYRWVLRTHGRDDAIRAVASMRQGRVLTLDEKTALRAAEVGIEFRLPLADSIIYATARTFGAVVWTQDVDFEGLEGVNYFAKQKER